MMRERHALKEIELKAQGLPIRKLNPKAVIEPTIFPQLTKQQKHILDRFFERENLQLLQQAKQEMTLPKKSTPETTKAINEFNKKDVDELIQQNNQYLLEMLRNDTKVSTKKPKVMPEVVDGEVVPIPTLPDTTVEPDTFRAPVDIEVVFNVENAIFAVVRDTIDALTAFRAHSPWMK